MSTSCSHSSVAHSCNRVWRRPALSSRPTKCLLLPPSRRLPQPLREHCLRRLVELSRRATTTSSPTADGLGGSAGQNFEQYDSEQTLGRSHSLKAGTASEAATRPLPIVTISASPASPPQRHSWRQPNVNHCPRINEASSRAPFATVRIGPDPDLAPAL